VGGGGGGGGVRGGGERVMEEGEGVGGRNEGECGNFGVEEGRREGGSRGGGKEGEGPLSNFPPQGKHIMHILRGHRF